MRYLKIIAIVSLFILSSACTNSNQNQSNMETTNNTIYPRGDKLPNDWFNGDAYLKPLVSKDHNNEFSVGSLTFEPSARTHWHTHPKGQTLLVIEGNGFYQEKGKPAQAIKTGNVVVIPENTEHWHGASPNEKMVHIAITNFKDESQVTWLEPVSDAEYREAVK